MGWAPGRKAYWDAQVRNMCAKDGGVTVYETITLSEVEYKRLGGDRLYPGLPVPTARYVADYPYVRGFTDTILREDNPRVARSEETITRRSDGKVLARAIRYSRSGGDFPTGMSEATSFTCPQGILLSTEIFKLSAPK